MNNRRVVITGMGILSPIGLTLDDYWKSLIEGKSGADYIEDFDTTDFDTKFACIIKNFEPTDYIDRKPARRMDRFTHFAVAGADLAVQDSGIDFEKVDSTRAGVILGSGVGGMYTYEREYKVLFEKGPQRVSPFFIPMMIADIAPGHVSIKYGLNGPNFSTVSACASSSHALGDAFRTIKYGIADVMISGGSEAALTQMGVAGFNSMKAISTRNDNPQAASRPFDKDRDGFVIGEGAGILILESLDNALKRNAKIYAEIKGIGFSADAYHITAPVPDGSGAANAMTAAMQESGLKPEDIQYVNAHGTSTPPNDPTETKAIKKALGEHAYNVSISSTKSMIGHFLGASGAAEAIATVLMINNSKIHPTINLENPDPECDLDYTPFKAKELDITNALSNSFGFGGHNVCIAIQKYNE